MAKFFIGCFVFVILGFLQGCNSKDAAPEKVFFQKVYHEGNEQRSVMIYIENYSMKFSKIMNEQLIQIAECYHQKFDKPSSRIWNISFINSLKPFKGAPWWHEDIDWEEIDRLRILSVLYEIRDEKNLYEIKEIEIKRGYRRYDTDTILSKINGTFCEEKVGVDFVPIQIQKQTWIEDEF